MAMTKPPDRGRPASSKTSRSTNGLPEDPVAFVKRVLREKPYDKKEDILSAVARSRRVSVVGCNGSGKDWAAARAALWWVPRSLAGEGYRDRPPPPARSMTLFGTRSGPPKAGHRTRFPGRMYRTSRYEIDDQSFALGFSTSSPYKPPGLPLAPT